MDTTATSKISQLATSDASRSDKFVRTPPESEYWRTPKPKPSRPPADVSYFDSDETKREFRRHFRKQLNLAHLPEWRKAAQYRNLKIYLRNGCNSYEVQRNECITWRTVERWKHQWRLWKIDVPIQKPRRPITDNLSGSYPYPSISEKQSLSLSNTCSSEETASFDTTVSGIESDCGKPPERLSHQAPRRFTDAEKTEFVIRLTDMLARRRIKLTPQQGSRLLGIGLTRLPDESPPSLLAFLARCLRRPTLKNAYAYALRCISTRQTVASVAPKARAAPVASVAPEAESFAAVGLADDFAAALLKKQLHPLRHDPPASAIRRPLSHAEAVAKCKRDIAESKNKKPEDGNET